MYTLSLHDALPISLGGTQGQATDIEIHAKRIIKMREKINEILAERSGQPIDVIEADTDRDNFMSAPEDRKSTRLNSSHVAISYAVFCLKKKKSNKQLLQPVLSYFFNEPLGFLRLLKGFV